jgi:hypothetical protein
MAVDRAIRGGAVWPGRLLPVLRARASRRPCERDPRAVVERPRDLVAFLWSLCWLLDRFLLEPLAAWGGAKLRIRRDDAPPFSRRRWMVGAGLIAAALVTRLLAAPMFTDLTRRLTIL